MASKRVDFSFTKESFIYLLFFRKKCPNCNASKMKKIVRKDFVGEGKSILITHFGDKPDAYWGSVFYKCQKCGSIYHIEDLANNIQKCSSETDLIPKDEKVRISSHKKKNTKGTKLFFNIVALAMVLMLLNGAIAARDILVVIVFMPIIFVFWLISYFILN